MVLMFRRGGHNVWLTVGLISLIIALGILPLATGAWPWVLMAALTNPSVYTSTFLTQVQTVLLVLGIIFTIVGFM